MFKRIGNVSEPVVTKGQEVRAKTFCNSSLGIFTLMSDVCFIGLTCLGGSLLLLGILEKHMFESADLFLC